MEKQETLNKAEDFGTILGMLLPLFMNNSNTEIEKLKFRVELLEDELSKIKKYL